MQRHQRWTRSALAVLLALAMGVEAGTVHAAPPTAYVFGKNGNGVLRAKAWYSDSRDRICVNDEYTDDHSGVVQYKRRGTRWNQGWLVWDHDTNNGIPACKTVIIAENSRLVMRACVGEWAPNQNRRVILWCGEPTRFRS